MTMTASKLLRWLEETTAAGLVPTGTDARQFRRLLQQAPLCGLQPAVARGSWLGPSVLMYKGQLSEEAREKEVVAGQPFSQPQRCLSWVSLVSSLSSAFTVGFHLAQARPVL